MHEDDHREAARRPNGDAVDAVVLSALDRLGERRARVRDPQTGRWLAANGGRLETGEHSELFWNDLEPARAAIVDAVRAQLAITDDDAPETLLGVAEAYAEARLIRRSEFLQLTRVVDLPTNPKQRRRAHERRRRHLAAWALAFDREMKAATALGFVRGAKKDAIDVAEIGKEAR